MVCNVVEYSQNKKEQKYILISKTKNGIYCTLLNYDFIPPPFNNKERSHYKYILSFMTNNCISNNILISG